MRRIEALLLLSSISPILAGDVPRPRGVGPEFAKFYKSPDAFTCISHPSITLSPSQINDDFCDCPDGSDEPGTAACTYLSTLSPPQPLPASPSGNSNVTVALPGFWCRNKGHKGAYLPFGWVNDGVCDWEVCCDGSDEWEGVGGVKCEDKCAAMGKEWRKLEEVRAKRDLNAARKKADLVKEAQELRRGVVASIEALKAEIAKQEGRAEELKRKYEDVERRERGKVVGSKGKGSKVTILAGLAKLRVEELRDGLVYVIDKKKGLEDKVKELEAILTTFKEEYNPNFNDEGVKRAVKSWEDYAANKVVSDDSALERDIDEVAKPDTETEGINWAEWESIEEESDTDALYQFEAYLPLAAREWIHQKLTDFRVMLVENGILAEKSNTNSESKAVSDARSAYQEVNDDVGIKKVSLGDQELDLEKDYGENDIFRALKNTCISKDSGEYTYELCWLDRTTQKSKKGGGNTGMGNFARFEEIEVDEEVDKDGKGLGKGKRVALKYENGQHCWNGPSRQTTVVLACAEKDEIWKVWEQEKCMYRMDVGTPAACQKGETKAEGKETKDEL